MKDLDHLPNLVTIPAPKPPREFKAPTAEEVMVARLAVDQLRSGVAPVAAPDNRDVAAELAAIQLPDQPDEVSVNQATKKSYEEVFVAQAARMAASREPPQPRTRITVGDILGYAAVAVATLVAGFVVLGLVAGVNSWGLA